MNHPTEDELRGSFEEELASVRAGRGLASDSGLDGQTEAALWEIARAYPNIPDSLVESARRAFAGQLDGTNAQEREARLKRMFEQVKREAANEDIGTRTASRARTQGDFPRPGGPLR
ncbi:hypothetical protein [Nocardia sp. BMG51109]|uniref:hypothetical protein n=1 Tax=Nocardia sp. BMG51109 TaxID=1056816 RepID=UPI0004AFAF67|nr:hypothetical protein [Nocardia sp. BMG51109]